MGKRLYVSFRYDVLNFIDFILVPIYREKFGLHRVDFDDPSRKRTPKASAKYFKDLVSNNGFIRP